MKFSQLYKDNREAVERALRAMWCGESGNESQQAYSEKLREIIKQLFAPKEAVPVVQCMNSYESVHSVSEVDAKNLVGGLWTKSYSPYEHQYKSWKALLNDKFEGGKPMSICVTTGTGSGKTECFMLPLVKDLIDKGTKDQIQALFLYPLNALMEDQKERLEELLEGTNLTYTVYNGDLPEDEPGKNDHSDQAERLRKRIKQIRGYNEQTGEYKFKHMLHTRRLVRKYPPNILLTNPTMLEYILLRGKDAVLTNHAQKSLSWIVIDETHTYTGAGAAEMAMLLRRVLLAFGVEAANLRFATSSATFGNGSNPKEEEEKLKTFISGITGVSTSQVAVIGGKRIGEDVIPDNGDRSRLEKIFHDEYVRLDELFEGEGSIEDKLSLLDAMCQRVPVKDGVPLLKAKVHYFYRVPNNGLYVRLTEHDNGAFKIYTQNNISEDTEDNPMLELYRCKHCGEYVAVAHVNKQPGNNFGKYFAVDRDESDMFDLEEVEDENSLIDYTIIGLAKNGNTRGDDNTTVSVVGGKLVVSTGEVDTSQWHLVANTHRKCPYCNSKLSHNKTDDDNTTADDLENEDSAYLVKFRTSPEFISRVMAPSVLDNLDKIPSNDPDKIILHDGQQYISFADSRQLAAKATMKQNIEQERNWVYSRIFHELCRKKAQHSQVTAEINKLTTEMVDCINDTNKMLEIAAKINTLKASAREYLTWDDIAELLSKDKYCKVYCAQFVKRSGDSEELDQNGGIPQPIIDKYIQSIMVMYLSTRPASDAAPETLGLFCTCYPQLEKIKLPAEVDTFNNLLSNDANKITENDWHSLLQVYMDYTVRSNQSFFLKLSDNNPIDIFACERFATEKPRRRPVIKINMEPNKVSQSRAVRYLCQLLAQDKDMGIGDVYRKTDYYQIIYNVMEALWRDVTIEGAKLLEQPVHWDKDSLKFVRDNDDAMRFNLKYLCFKLYDDVYLCDTNTDSSQKHTLCLRPIENNFKGFSPYLDTKRQIRMLKKEWHEEWKTYPYYKGSENEVTPKIVRQWAEENRKLLWDNHLWGEDGIFANRLTNIYAWPNLFVQAEHTAQVDKDVSRTLQTDFKEHTINILACSTTMEMGVDLGNLEVVMLTSVPPMPANYKQRAGRSGRNNRVQSACITLCGSDAIGLRTLYNPIQTIINRPVQVPMVDLKSPQVVQRHVNSYLVRAFGVFTDGQKGGRLTQAVYNYYSNFTTIKDGDRIKIVDENNNEMNPNHKLGDKTGTMYEMFNKKCLERLDDNVAKELIQLLRDTVYDGLVDYVVEKAMDTNKRCYKELNIKLEDLKMVYAGANNNKYLTMLKMKYYEIILNRLLNFWATNRFTPNANMPVNVLTLDLSNTKKKDFFSFSSSSNPSYGLREALSQYAPGNSIAVDGVVYIVRGVQFTNMYQDTIKTFKQIYRNTDRCVVDNDSIDGKLRWMTNQKDGLELIEPIGFVPDMNEEKSRIMDTNKYSHVSAQLIETTDWADNVTEPHLFSVRSNRESGDAKILYYNEGIGYGYCLCSTCGRAVVETEVADPDNPMDNLPMEMNNKKSKTQGKSNFHYMISAAEPRKYCFGSRDESKLRRNVIIGDRVQTDFSEIRIRHKGKKHWIRNRSEEESLLFTLGIVFTQSLLDILGKEKGAVDFTIMPNGHICLFDTNPGGAGYANQMTSIPLMKEVINASKEMLLEAKRRNSKDFLLNKFTLRYIEQVDIDAALDWIQEEKESTDDLPDEIAFVSKDATETSIVNLQNAIGNSAQPTVIFVNDDYNKWDYEGDEHGWRTHFAGRIKIHDTMTRLCVVKRKGEAMPEPVLEMLRSAKAKFSKNILQINTPYANHKVYPIAYVNGVLYFTNSKENAALNDSWANGTLYCARLDSPTDNASVVDLAYKPSTKLFKFECDDYALLKTSELGNAIQSMSGGVVDKFINHCKSSNETLKITYQDEHLKSVMGMVLTLQTIGYFIKQIDKDFSIEFLSEEFRDDNYKGTITANLQNERQRDMVLTDLTKGWLNDLETDFNISGHLIPIKSARHNTLPHWRVLSIECGGKCLSIYPDGGFVNGWNLLKDWNVNKKKFTLDNTDTRDVIVLQRNKEIKFDVTIEDV